ncbi:MAG: SpoIIE family protein phosphatase [Leptospirales bacterium]
MDKMKNQKKKVKKQKEPAELVDYIHKITHDALRTLVPLTFTLVPLFGLLDYYIVPEHIVNKFWAYRLIVTVILILQYAAIRSTKYGKFSIWHGYFLSALASLMIVQMTVDVGGFDASYYAGLNLVMIAVNIMMPWKAVHSATNAIITISLYVLMNALSGASFKLELLINNLYFLSSTGVIVTAIGYVKYSLISKEFFLRAELQKTKDALWGEMEIAKKIQTALLPADNTVGDFEIAAKMIPADEVGGDYYDIIQSDKDHLWMTVGDVSGHGVESGLIMMMTQTSIASLVQEDSAIMPSDVIADANKIIKENIRRLNVSRYMTICVMKMTKREITYAGKHQDIMIHRASSGDVDVYETEGTWIGLTDDIKHGLPDITIKLNKGDTILAFTDGVTEAFRKDHEMYGQERLEVAFKKLGTLAPDKIIEALMAEIVEFQDIQYDDITMVVGRVLN